MHEFQSLSLTDGLKGIPAGILIVGVAADAVVVAVQGQGLVYAAQVAVLSEEVCRHYAVVPGTQVLALDVGVVGLPVVGVLVLVGGCTVGQFSGGAVLVGLGQVAFCICQACYAASRVVG